MRILIVLSFVLAFSQLALADEIMLRVKAVKYESTPYLHNCGKDCISLSSWHIYTVKVREVLEGDFIEKKLKVAVLEHTARKLSSRKNWKIIIEKFRNKEFAEKLGIDYVVIDQPKDEKDT